VYFCSAPAAVRFLRVQWATDLTSLDYFLSLTWADEVYVQENTALANTAGFCRVTGELLSLALSPLLTSVSL
jgi:hypothetical protein